MKKLLFIIFLARTLLFCGNGNAAEYIYEVEKEHFEEKEIKANMEGSLKMFFQLMVLFDLDPFYNNKYTDEDIWNIAHQLIDILFFTFQEEIKVAISESKEFEGHNFMEIKRGFRESCAGYVFNNHEAWTEEAFRLADEMILLEKKENIK